MERIEGFWAAVVAVVLCAGCASVRGGECGGETASGERAPQDLAERIEADGDWLPSDVVLVGRVRVDQAADKPEGAEGQAGLAWTGPTIESLVEHRIGLEPATFESVVVAVGKRWSVLIAEGPVEFAAETMETVEVGGRSVRRLELKNGGMSPLWALRISEEDAPPRWAVFTTGLGLQRALARARSEGSAATFANSESWQRLRPLFEDRQAPVAVGLELGVRRWGKRLTRWFRQQAGLMLEELPDRVGASWGGTLEVEFRGREERLAAFREALRTWIADQRKDAKALEENIGRLPLPPALIGVVGTEGLHHALSLVDVGASSGPVHLELPVSAPSSTPAMAGFAAMYVPYLAESMWREELGERTDRAHDRVKTLVGELGRYFHEHCRFPESAGPVPARGSCCPASGAGDGVRQSVPRCEPSEGRWTSEPWTTLGFAPGGDQYFAYELDGNGKAGADAKMTVSAYADFDCDGEVRHVFTVDLVGDVHEREGKKDLCVGSRTTRGHDRQVYE